MNHSVVLWRIFKLPERHLFSRLSTYFNHIGLAPINPSTSARGSITHSAHFSFASMRAGFNLPSITDKSYCSTFTVGGMSTRMLNLG